tara:strand:- start:278 stop:523 length:246 start_codon:yes stop_codon:yes gene_type:complete
MDDVIDMIANNASAADVSDKLKDMLMQKASQQIDVARPQVAAQMFANQEAEEEPEEETPETPEASAEIETEEEPTPEEETD